MLKRLQEICGVGCFSACRAPQIQFERMSLIYGENSYGKTTLCDILRSLAENDPSHITDRLSVPPPANRGQQVQISLALPNQNQETSMTFRRGSWTSPLPGDLKIEVFDTDFIHRNLFTGLSIERQNHENITRFVLGDSGVRLAQGIAAFKSELRSVNKVLRHIESSVFSDISDIQGFVTLVVCQDLPTIEAAIAGALNILESDRRLYSDLDSPRSRPEPKPYSCSESIDNLATSVEEALSATFEQVHRDAEAKLLEHLHSHTNDPAIGRNWVQQGTILIQSDACPFCGQQIAGDAAELIAAYQAVFNDVFGRYARDTIASLDGAQREFARVSCADLPLRMEQNHGILHQYPELRSIDELRDQLERMDHLSAEVLRRLEVWADTHQRLTERLTAAVQSKKENVHASAPPWGAGPSLDQYSALYRATDEYNRVIQSLIAGIARFKSNLDPDQIENRIREGDDALQKLRLCKRRLELSDTCQVYDRALTREGEIQREIDHLQEALEQEQTAFLDRYFSAINRIFAQLGSRRFTISSERSRRGHMPTIQLRASFNGVQITPSRLGMFFSESDRRALALSIFWARLETQEEADLLRTIVILDDPVTSFDDGRIDRTIRLIELQLPRLRQVIVLSHYPGYLRTFFQRINGRNEQILVAKLFQNEVGSHLTRAAPIDFTETDHQRAYRRIVDFIERRHHEDIFGDLRVFLETELRSRHHRTITKYDIGGLQFASLIDELTRLGAMLTDTRQSIEPLRLTLNTDHHVWTTRSHEEKIRIAEDVISCAYERL